jgi:hypothetical protein
MLFRWCLALLVAVVAAADVQKLGPQIGTRVPDFRLTDQNSQIHTLESSMGSKGAMIVFFRSADW